MPRQCPRFIDSQVVIEISQITAEVRRKILRYAARRVRMVAEAGCPVASDEPDILVADAIADTLTGVVTWDRRHPLSYHLCSVVRTRTSNQIARAKRQRRVALEVMNDREELISVEYVAGPDPPRRPDALLATAHVTHELYDTVRRHAIRDALLLALLDAYALGCVKPREVMRLTRMTRAEFVNARRRLDRALVQVPVVLRRAAHDVMQQ
jgi:hypothetical protein